MGGGCNYQISSWDSNTQTLLWGSVRKLVPTHYGLKSGGKTKMVQSNTKHIEVLLAHSSFHFKVTALAVVATKTKHASLDCEGWPLLLRAPNRSRHHIQHVVFMWSQQLWGGACRVLQSNPTSNTHIANDYGELSACLAFEAYLSCSQQDRILPQWVEHRYIHWWHTPGVEPQEGIHQAPQECVQLGWSQPSSDGENSAENLQWPAASDVVPAYVTVS